LQGGAVAVAAIASPWLGCRRDAASRVAILSAPDYSGDLEQLLLRGLRESRLDVRGRRVLLKPNLVEYQVSRKINTHPALVAAAVQAFRSLGAAEVLVGDGPGHQRDTEMLLELSGLGDALTQVGSRFVDLNTDDVRRVPCTRPGAGFRQLWLPETLLGADLVVSMPKMKTHHWAGVTLSLKNLFGVMPGVRYGWPKNVLHWQGIDRSIVDIATTVRPGLAIIDGIEGMEGDGPLHGEAIAAGVIVMSDRPVAADATAARLMGIDPAKVQHLAMLAEAGEPVAVEAIRQVGERLADHRREFRLLPKWAHLRA
jgi:uncharacterized protein (DUF362 family)